MALVRSQAAATRKGGSSAGSGEAGRARGLGASEGITVKGRKATARQRHVLDEALSQAQKDHASRRVMIALVMALTQETACGEDMGSQVTYRGPLQQSSAWNSAADAKDPAKATHAFLITGPSSWKKVHGGVKKAPGDLGAAVDAVQHAGTPADYRQWKSEAEDTVGTWLGQDGNFTLGTRRKRYEFTRGERGGQRENSWDAAARLVEEVGAYRWAAGNVFYAVSGDELRAGAPSLTIRGTEPWLTHKPSWTWSSNRPVGEVTMEVLTEHWNVMPGASVVLAKAFGPLAGRFLVANVSGESLDSPVVTVVLRRPTRLKEEPAAETMDVSGGGGSSDLHTTCKSISDHRSEYLYGGGHGPKLSKMKSSDRMDCSSSCSLALKRAKMFKGEVAITSGAFASSWGKPGKGRTFTVWANGEHVWIEGYDDKGKFAWRFDTSHHGGKSGPALTTKPRNDHGRFTARHWPGA